MAKSRKAERKSERKSRRAERKSRKAERKSRRAERKSRKQEGGKRKGTKRAPSKWNNFVKKIYEEGKRKDRNYSFGAALREASLRKKAGNY